LQKIEAITKLLDEHDYEKVIISCQELITLSLAGLHYFQTFFSFFFRFHFFFQLLYIKKRYDWIFLRTVITFGYIGWMIFSLTYVLTVYSDWLKSTSLEKNAPQESKRNVILFFLIFSFLFFFFPAVEHLVIHRFNWDSWALQS